MKRRVITLLALLFLFITCNSQSKDKPLPGAFGLTFGMFKDSVIAIMASKGGVVIQDLQYEDMISFDGLTLGGRKTYFTGTFFSNGMLCMIVFTFKPELDAKVFDFYDALKIDISNKYGIPTCKRKFSGIYQDGDGYELQAVKKGYADILCSWTFLFGNQVTLRIDEDLTVKLSYIDRGSTDELIKKNQTKNSKDF